MVSFPVPVISSCLKLPHSASVPENLHSSEVLTDLPLRSDSSQDLLSLQGPLNPDMSVLTLSLLLLAVHHPHLRVPLLPVGLPSQILRPPDRLFAYPHRLSYRLLWESCHLL